MRTILANQIADLGARPAVVTIDGFSGAGKTVLGEWLARELTSSGPAHHATLLEVELWAHGWQDLAGGVSRVSDVVRALRSGPARTSTWNWWTEEEEAPIVLEPRPIILVVGCGAGQIPADLSIWIDSDETLRADRVSARDPYDWSEHWAQWARQERALLDRYDARAHATYRLISDDQGLRLSQPGSIRFA